MSVVSRYFWGVTKFKELLGASGSKITVAGATITDMTATAQSIDTLTVVDHIKFTAVDGTPYDATSSPGMYYDATTGLMASDGTSWKTVTLA
jgi:hypothetical protein